MDVPDLMHESLSCQLHSSVGVEVDRRGKLWLLAIKLIFPFLHGLDDCFFNDGWIVDGCVMHGLNSLHYGFLCQCLGEPYDCAIEFDAINITL